MGNYEIRNEKYKINKRILNKEFCDICIQYKTEFSDNYETYTAHSFILSLFEYFNKLFHNTKPEIISIDNKYYNLYKIIIISEEEIFKQSIDTIYNIYFKEEFKIEPDNYSKLLYSFDYFVLNKVYMKEFLKEIIENENNIERKEEIFNTIYELLTIDDNHKKFIYKLFYDKILELQTFLKNNDIVLDEFISHKSHYDSVSNTLILSNDMRELKYFEHKDIIYEIQKIWDYMDNTYIYWLIVYPKDEFIGKNVSCDKEIEKVNEKVKNVEELRKERFNKENDNLYKTQYANINVNIYDLDELDIINTYISYDEKNEEGDYIKIKEYKIPNKIIKNPIYDDTYSRDRYYMFTDGEKKLFEIKIKFINI